MLGNSHKIADFYNFFFEFGVFSVNVDLYKVLVKELAQILERQFAGNAESRAAGMVINTMGWIESTGYEVLDFLFFITANFFDELNMV